jgi:hypothetical protein
MKVTVFLDVAPYNLVHVYGLFRGMYCLHLQSEMGRSSALKMGEARSSGESVASTKLQGQNTAMFIFPQNELYCILREEHNVILSSKAVAKQ